MSVKWRCKKITRTFLAVGKSPSCVIIEVTWSCHVLRNLWSFVNDATKCVCVLMIYICRKYSKSHMAVFIGDLLCNSVYGCIFVCLLVQDYRESRVTRGGIFGWCLQRILFTISRLFLFVQTKYISTEICGLFVIIWILMSVQIKIPKMRGLFRSDIHGFHSMILCTGHFFFLFLRYLFLSLLMRVVPWNWSRRRSW